MGLTVVRMLCYDVVFGPDVASIQINKFLLDIPYNTAAVMAVFH